MLPLWSTGRTKGWQTTHTWTHSKNFPIAHGTLFLFSSFEPCCIQRNLDCHGLLSMSFLFVIEIVLPTKPKLFASASYKWRNWVVYQSGHSEPWRVEEGGGWFVSWALEVSVPCYHSWLELVGISSFESSLPIFSYVSVHKYGDISAHCRIGELLWLKYLFHQMYSKT
jgi:hypothetical protein